jgi:hypothetical protein
LRLRDWVCSARTRLIFGLLVDAMMVFISQPFGVHQTHRKFH